jgi:hypothetical protein
LIVPGRRKQQNTTAHIEMAEAVFTLGQPTPRLKRVNERIGMVDIPRDFDTVCAFELSS